VNPLLQPQHTVASLAAVVDPGPARLKQERENVSEEHFPEPRGQMNKCRRYLPPQHIPLEDKRADIGPNKDADNDVAVVVHCKPNHGGPASKKLAFGFIIQNLIKEIEARGRSTTRTA
jgi:hypothetical protein